AALVPRPRAALVTGSRLNDRRRLHVPDLVGVLLDGAVTRESARRGNVDDRLARPRFGIGIAGIQLAMGAAVIGEVREMPVVIAPFEQCPVNGLEQPRLIAVEMISEDQIERRASLGIVGVMPVRTVPARALLHLLCRQAEQEKILLAR